MCHTGGLKREANLSKNTEEYGNTKDYDYWKYYKCNPEILFVDTAQIKEIYYGYPYSIYKMYGYRKHKGKLHGPSKGVIIKKQGIFKCILPAKNRA